jgi:hypothetical protein
MAHTLVHDNTYGATSPNLFPRLTKGGQLRSWAPAIPATIVMVALVVASAFFASKASENDNRAKQLESQIAQSQQSSEAAVRAQLQAQKDLSLARSAGRTALILNAPAKSESKSWAVATVGEENGKSWVRLQAYGLPEAAEGQTLRAWYEPAEGDPIPAGTLERASDGSAFLLAKDLPGVDQGKRVFVTADKSDAAKPAGDVLMEAQLPKLQPQTVAQAATEGKAEVVEEPAKKADTPETPKE